MREADKLHLWRPFRMCGAPLYPFHALAVNKLRENFALTFVISLTEYGI